MSTYEDWLKASLAFRKQEILNRISDVEQIMSGLRMRIFNDDYLNRLGELQAAGVMLDTAIAAYVTEKQALKNYQEMKA